MRQCLITDEAMQGSGFYCYCASRTHDIRTQRWRILSKCKVCHHLHQGNQIKCKVMVQRPRRLKSSVRRRPFAHSLEIKKIVYQGGFKTGSGSFFKVNRHKPLLTSPHEGKQNLFI